MGHEGHEHDHRGHGHGHGHGHSEAAESHKAHAPASVATFVITCSDTRTEATDQSGRVIREKLEAEGHTVCGRRLIPDEPEALRAALNEASEAGARAVIISGGTGIARRDQAVETLRPMLDKELPGFGELFRMLSFQEIGSAAMLSRALAGTVQGMLVFALPGSSNAARLAMDRLILPELGHAIRELSR